MLERRGGLPPAEQRRHRKLHMAYERGVLDSLERRLVGAICDARGTPTFSGASGCDIDVRTQLCQARAARRCVRAQCRAQGSDDGVRLRLSRSIISGPSARQRWRLQTIPACAAGAASTPSRCSTSSTAAAACATFAMHWQRSSARCRSSTWLHISRRWRPSRSSARAETLEVNELLNGLLQISAHELRVPIDRSRVLDTTYFSPRRDRRLHDRPTLAPRVTRSSSSCANVSPIASAAPVPAASRASFEG